MRLFPRIIRITAFFIFRECNLASSSFLNSLIPDPIKPWCVLTPRFMTLQLAMTRYLGEALNSGRSAYLTEQETLVRVCHRS